MTVQALCSANQPQFSGVVALVEFPAKNALRPPDFGVREAMKQLRDELPLREPRVQLHAQLFGHSLVETLEELARGRISLQRFHSRVRVAPAPMMCDMAERN